MKDHAISISEPGNRVDMLRYIQRRPRYRFQLLQTEIFDGEDTDNRLAMVTLLHRHALSLLHEYVITHEHTHVFSPSHSNSMKNIALTTKESHSIERVSIFH